MRLKLLKSRSKRLRKQLPTVWRATLTNRGRVLARRRIRREPRLNFRSQSIA